MTLASRLRCKSTARFANYQDFLQKNRRKILYDGILLYRPRKFHSYNPFFAPPLWNEVLPFSIPFDGVWRNFMLSSHFTTSKMLHYRQLFSINFPLPSELSQKTSEFFQKTWELSHKTSEFFSALSEKRFLTANRNTNETENGRATTLEVQPLIARIDNFQAWTHNYNNITRAQRKLLRCGAGKAIIAAKRSRHTCEIGLFTLEQT